MRQAQALAACETPVNAKTHTNPQPIVKTFAIALPGQLARPGKQTAQIL